MQRVRQPVERRPVQRPVDPVEVERDPDRRQNEQRNEPDRPNPAGGIRPEQHRDPAVRHHPEGHDLVGGPDPDPARQRPEHVVAGLTAQRELAPLRRQVAGVVFQPLALPAQRVEEEMQAARDQHHQNHVPQPDPGDPARRQIAHRLERRLKPRPADQRDADQDRPLGQPEPVGPEPARHRHRIRRPYEEGRDPDRQIRPVIPVAALGRRIRKIAHGRSLAPVRAASSLSRSRVEPGPPPGAGLWCAPRMAVAVLKQGRGAR